MFQLYLLLRLKNFGKIVIELGIFRIVFLTILTVAAIMILFLAENRFAIPVVCVLLLAGYHNVREDKEFLRTLTPHLSVFLIKEYATDSLRYAGSRINRALNMALMTDNIAILEEEVELTKKIFPKTWKGPDSSFYGKNKKDFFDKCFNVRKK